MDRQEEVMLNIVDHARQEAEVKRKLREAELTERQFMTQMGIRNDSKLKVHIVDAQNLEDNSQYQVKVFQDNSYSETNVRAGTGPIWNEAIVFDIKDPYQPVIVQLVNQRLELVLESALDLNSSEIRDYSNQGQEIWCYAQFDENEIEVDYGPKLRLRIHFNYSDVQRFESLRYEWHNYIAEDIEELELIRTYISNLVTPFGFLRQRAEEKV